MSVDLDKSAMLQHQVTCPRIYGHHKVLLKKKDIKLNGCGRSESVKSLEIVGIYYPNTLYKSLEELIKDWNTDFFDLLFNKLDKK